MSTTLTDNAFGIEEVLKQLGLKENNYGASTGLKHTITKGKKIDSYSPVDGKLIGSVNAATAEDYVSVMKTAEEAFKVWRLIPAPKRGEIVRQMGEELA
jgi:aldehyde dehydrogenase (NAD+)